MPDPTIAVVSKAIEQMLVCRPDAVIALGGGSAIDTAKAAGLLYSGMSQTERPELIAIPTTSGTGSEVTSFAVISDPEKQAKYPLVDDSMVPDTALLDQRFTVSVPPPYYGGYRHGCADSRAGGIRFHRRRRLHGCLCGESGPAGMALLKTAVEDGSCMEAREKMHNASCLAGVAFNGHPGNLSQPGPRAGRKISYSARKKQCDAALPCDRLQCGADTPGRRRPKTVREVANMLGISAGTDKATVHGLIRQIRILMNQIHIPQYITECGVDREESWRPQAIWHCLL